ncbi:MAG: hypothetical protein ABR548_03165 [Actinomycetota bacterium]|nr:hypothetical protein [Actinomycetota bacterium]
MSPEETESAPARTRQDWVIPVSVALLFMVVSMAFRVPCVTHQGDLRFSEEHLCYTDVFALYGTEGLNHGRVPYFEQRGDGKYVEYPVLTGVWMYATARVSTLIVGGDHRGDIRGYDAFFWVNQAGFALLILGAAAALGLLVGWKRALLFAAAPTLIFHGGVSWDMLAVAPFVFGLRSFARREDAAAGVWLGIGAAAKLFPIFAVPFLAVQRWREGDKRAAGLIAGVSFAVVAVLNAPFAIGAQRGWREFFLLNKLRPADWDSIWYHLDRTWHIGFYKCSGAAGARVCRYDISTLNMVTAALFIAGVAGLMWWQWRRLKTSTEVAPGIQAATALAMFLAVLWFLAINKVWSPQYGIWLLPFWAFAFELRLRRLIAAWLALQALEIFVFVTRFWMFADKVTYSSYRMAIFTRLAAFIVVVGVLIAALPRKQIPAPEVVT